MPHTTKRQLSDSRARENRTLARALARTRQARAALDEGAAGDAVTAAHEAANLFLAVDGTASPDAASALILESRAYSLAGDETAALQAAESAQAIARRLPDAPPLNVIRVQARQRLGQVRSSQGDHSAARELLAVALAEAERTLAPDDPVTASVRTNLAALDR